MLHQYCTVCRELPPLAFTDHPGEVPVFVSDPSVSASNAKLIILATNVSLAKWNGPIEWMKPKVHCAVKPMLIWI
jgi:hypothetical protein